MIHRLSRSAAREGGHETARRLAERTTWASVDDRAEEQDLVGKDPQEPRRQRAIRKRPAATHRP